jgi:hypothetical protein
LTANVEDGQLVFADDVYGLDPVPASLAAVETAPTTATATAAATTTSTPH